jgi:cytochrome d ubiquinol oxidase subunit II
MELTTVWFILITVLWVGYLVLDGFDFGVGMLLPVLAHNDTERRVMINTIGPLWDGNEVWLIVAGGATFAAFPEWYATLFSGFYLPLFIILVALILRGVAFEYRGKRNDPRWRQRWDVAIVIGSLLPAVLWGVALSNVVAGVPINKHGEYTGGFFTLINVYGLLGGLTTLVLFLTHGSFFIALKTVGDIQVRANRLALRLGYIAAAVGVVFLAWTVAKTGGAAVTVLVIAAAAALVAGLLAGLRGRDGWAFAGTAASIGLATIALFTGLFPNVMPSSLDSAWNLTVTNASSTHHTLTIMTIVALICTPVVLAYQSWSYWTFRKRISIKNIPS